MRRAKTAEGSQTKVRKGLQLEGPEESDAAPTGKQKGHMTPSDSILSSQKCRKTGERVGKGRKGWSEGGKQGEILEIEGRPG